MSSDESIEETLVWLDEQRAAAQVRDGFSESIQVAHYEKEAASGITAAEERLCVLCPPLVTFLTLGLEPARVAFH